ncbi:GSCFA domain-containing protein [Methylocystis sp. ATCC 49242]|uniref:GSCFA domain-containing protein n=1 Tax=Methylocystis sp. ATCC 49242 TaxID=622637 RepID=UPI00130EC813|nr:GSCFA domain-containing protein [Methylocystis sp. ATCC 49242]
MLQPKFKFDPGSRVFTIGSCFARSIERALCDLGFQIPVFDFYGQHPDLFVGNGINMLNRYTPPSIFQELEWTRKIMDRDDTVHLDDIEPLLLDAGSGLVYDLSRLTPKEYGITLEQALAERRLIYSLYQSAFDCDAVVITLGHIECWKDTETGMYVDLSRGVLRNPERFQFRRIDYNEALQCITDAIEIINRDNPTNILLTTSPVPLARTFTSDDVIVANTYSKSVLRAVAGSVSESNPNVDYFPSFESIMLTKERKVWMDDLIHVDPSFVGSIMVRVTESYVPDAARDFSLIEKMYRLITLANAGDWENACSVFEKLPIDNLPDQPLEFFVCAAELAARRQDVDLVRAMNARAVNVDTDLNLRLSKGLRAVGLEDLASRRQEEALKLGTRSTDSLSSWIHVLDVSGRVDDLDWLLHKAEEVMPVDVSTAWMLASVHEKLGRSKDQERLLRTVLREDPLHEDARLKLAHLLIEGECRAEGMQLLRSLATDGSTSEYLHPLVSELLTLGRIRDARSLVERLVAANPEHGGLLQLASTCQMAAACNSGDRNPDPVDRGIEQDVPVASGSQ